MQSSVLLIVVIIALKSSSAQVEECPEYCSPVNNNYGPACASVGRSFVTFPNLCELYKQRCANRRNAGPAIEFVKDGSCTTSVMRPRPARPDGCPLSCPANSGDSAAVCASVGTNFKTFPNYCHMMIEKCAHQLRGGSVVSYVRDGSCSTPVIEDEDEGQKPLRQVPEKIIMNDVRKNS